MNETPPEHLEELPEGAEAPPPGVRAMAAMRWALLCAMGVLALWSVTHATACRSAGPEKSAPGAEVRYTCSMHPQIVQDHPGECPICGMTLVKVEGPPPAAAAPPPATTSSTMPRGVVPIDLPPERIQLSGIRTSTVEERPLPSGLRTTGVVAPSERSIVRVEARYAGVVEELPANETGVLVHRGDVLARIFGPEVHAAASELVTAKRWKDQPALAEGARRRLALLGLSPEDVRAVESQDVAPRTLPVRAPATGTVVSKPVLGASVMPGATLFELQDLSTLWVMADVYEKDAPSVRVGQAASFTTPADPSLTRGGTVSLVSPSIDQATRTMKVRIEIDNPDLALRPGAYGDVVLDTGAAGPRPVIPREAVIDTGRERYVFVVSGAGRFEPRLVRTGDALDGSDDVPVLDGLATGEIVVTSGAFLIDSESQLQAARRGAAS